MLTRQHRLTSGRQFAPAIRHGRRAGSRTLVVHLLVPSPDASDPHEPSAPRVGFVVSKAVGNAVVRNRVRRRLRHLVAARLGTLDAHASLVVRALPPAAEADFDTLGTDLDRSLARARPAAVRSEVRS